MTNGSIFTAGRNGCCLPLSVLKKNMAKSDQPANRRKLPAESCTGLRIGKVAEYAARIPPSLVTAPQSHTLISTAVLATVAPSQSQLSFYMKMRTGGGVDGNWLNVGQSHSRSFPHIPSNIPVPGLFFP